MRPHPDIGIALKPQRLGGLGRHKTAPCDTTGITRRVRPKNLLAHQRMNTVRPDQHIARHDLAIAQSDRHAARRLFNAINGGVEPRIAGRHAADQSVQQIRAMGVQIGRAEDLFGQRHKRRLHQYLATAPVGETVGGGFHAKPRDVFAKAQPLQHPRGVGAHL